LPIAVANGSSEAVLIDRADHVQGSKCGSSHRGRGRGSEARAASRRRGTVGRAPAPRATSLIWRSPRS